MLDFVKKILSGNKSDAPKKSKKSGYYMELDESEETALINNTTAPANPAPKKPEPAKADKSEKKPEPAKAESKPKEKSDLSKVVPQPKKPEPVATAKKPQEEPATATFAPDNLITSISQPRRRPGPNLDMFLDMARQVKSPNT